MSDVNYLTTIGLEVHVQLNTKTKIFCGCSVDADAAPNTNVCPICLGYPGALPSLNETVVKYGIMTGLMIGSKINLYSKFDRKSYFYPDMSKDFQTTQFDLPICEGGSIDIQLEDGTTKAIGITRIHLEENAAKNFHLAKMSGVDFNRAGTPLIEVVTEPEIESPEEAYAFLQAIRQIVIYTGVSECNLELGQLRCDVNSSVRPEGQKELGERTEMKNLNSFKNIYNALKYEIERQKDVLRSGGTVSQETRRWNPDTEVTTVMRTKEDAHDYRYVTEPDLMPMVFDEEYLEKLRKDLPELPAKRRERFEKEFSIPAYDAGVLIADKAIADYFEVAAKQSKNPKLVSNLMMTEMLRILSETEKSISEVLITPEALAKLSNLVNAKTINSNTAKKVFTILLEKGGEPESIVKENGWAQVSDTGAIESFVDEAIVANPKSVSDFKAGKIAAVKFLVGQVMRFSKGKANPQLAEKLLLEKLK
jgi:aspartyl-tRNA(Asn)/glutamyl-tRNA(Gln) amidotransferase subunit B